MHVAEKFSAPPRVWVHLLGALPRVCVFASRSPLFSNCTCKLEESFSVGVKFKMTCDDFKMSQLRGREAVAL